MATAIIGVFLVCVGVAINNNTQLGNDPVGLIYDGIRQAAQLSHAQLGVVSNYINIGLIIILFFFGRKYINVGTLIYLVPYGFFISIGSYLYTVVFVGNTLWIRGLAGLVGCSLYYLGISLFVASNIGVDPFNGLMLTLRDKTGWSIRRSKITMDVVLIIAGVLLGGRFGAITILTALTTGLAIQYLSQLFSQLLYGERI